MLFSNTINELKRLNNEIRRIGFIFSVALQVVNIIYLLYASVTKRGILWVNVALLVVTVAYFIIYILAYKNKNGLIAKFNKTAKHVKKWIVITIKAFTLGVAIYGLYISSDNVTFLSMALVVFMLLGWVMQIIIELVYTFIERQIVILKTALMKDVEPFIKAGKAVAKPINAVKGVGSKIKGFFTKDKKKPEPVEQFLLPDKTGAELSKKERRKLEKRLKKERKSR